MFYWGELILVVCSHLNKQESTIERLENFLLDGLHRLHDVFFGLERVLHGLAIGADLSLMMGVGLRLYLLIRGGVVAVSRELLDALSHASMVLLVLEYFLHEIGDSRCKGIIVILPITIHDDTAMLDGGLVAVE